MDSVYEALLKKSMYGTDPGQPLSFTEPTDTGEVVPKKMEPEETEEPSSAYKGATSAANTIQKGGTGMDALGSGLTAAGAASANPYMVGAGLGLSVLSAGEKRKRQEEMNQYTAALAQNQARRDAIDNITRVYQGQKGLF